MNVGEMVAEAQRLSQLIDGGVTALRRAAQKTAEAEKDYRLARAVAWVRVNRESTTAKEREDEVNSITAGEREARDLAEGERQAALEALRSRRQQVSMLQTLISAQRVDQEFHRYQGGGQ